MIEVLTHKKDPRIISIYASENRTHQYIKQHTDRISVKYNLVILVKDFKGSLSVMGRKNKQKSWYRIF